jgi:hypothetical protein
MVLYNVPRSQLPGVKLRTPEQLGITVKAETHSTSPGFHVGGQQHWQQTHGLIGQDQQAAGLARMPSPLRMEQGQQAAGVALIPSPHRMEQGQQAAGLARMSLPQRQSPGSAGHSSPKLEHQLYGEREREASYEEYSQDRKRCKVQDSFHTISSQTQSQLLSPRGPPGSSGPALMRDTIVGSKYGEPSYSGNRCLSRMAPGPPISRSGPSVNAFDEPSPLGLTLRKTPSLLDLISMKLAQGGNGDPVGTSSADSIAAQDDAKIRPGKCLVPSVTAQDKLKASNFPATSLKIGTWERTSRYEGDLVGKCYYAKRKLVWEVLENGLKSKIEIQWSDISAMKASCPENLPGTLDIEVSRPPQFFRETNPQPRKHTLWQSASDFTGGQATICKRHSLQFPEGVLNRHYEKLVQCDPRLKALVEGALSSRPTPDFDHSSWMFDEKRQHLPGHQQIGHSTSLDGSNGDSPFIHPHRLLSMPGGLVNHGGIQSDPKAEIMPIKMQPNDLSSPSSVIDSRAGDDSGASDTEDLRPHDDLNEYDVNFLYPNSTSIGGHGEPDVKPSCNNLFMIGETGLSPDQKLAEIRHYLFEEGGWSNEQVMNSMRLGQLPDAFGEELPNPFNRILEGSDPSHFYSLSAVVKNEAGPEDHDWQGSTLPMMNGRLIPREPSVNSIMSCMNKNGSASDLLLHLPRVASLPQLFEAPSHAPGGRYDLPYSRPSYLGSDKLR